MAKIIFMVAQKLIRWKERKVMIIWKVKKGMIPIS